MRVTSCFESQPHSVPALKVVETLHSLAQYYKPKKLKNIFNGRCGGAEFAREKGIPVILFPKMKDEPDGLSPTDLVDALRFSGPTVHFVDEHYGIGRILAQSVVPVLPDDTAEVLAVKVLREEHSLYVDVVAALCKDRVLWREDGVRNEYRSHSFH
ncbi:Phosphoribosylglycinamide formyltransferase [Morus notabilis]|uniref:phosphoribosylglycinamide formyltransferase 1 n=1 Tax=Morus notabilis TaxID=981085 RepID=W9QUM6_9ROSA|nr:Phosphoribosylglycinamide formyltransferase [Morus notabilis]